MIRQVVIFRAGRVPSPAPFVLAKLSPSGVTLARFALVPLATAMLSLMIFLAPPALPAPAHNPLSAEEKSEPAASAATSPKTASADATSADAAAVPTAAEADWPQWLGPRGDGISFDESWSPELLPAAVEAWRAEVGVGYSSLAIAQDRVVTLGHAEGRETIFCLDVNTGRTVWSQSYPGELVDNLNQGGPAATATIAAGRVYTVGRGGQVQCRDMQSGKQIWRVDLRPLLEIELPEWGFSSSVVLHGDLALLQAGAIVALRPDTGKLVWKTAARKAAYGTPTVFKSGERMCVAALNSETLMIADASNGEILAEQDWTTDYDTNSTTPIVSGDKLFISTGYGHGGMLLRFAGGELTRVYESRSLANHFNNSVLWKGHLYGIHGNSHVPSQCSLRCQEWATGKLKWQKRGFGAGSLTLAGGKLVVLSDEGSLAIVDASPEGYREISRAELLTGECWTMPAVCRGRIFCRSTAGDVVCVDLRKNKRQP